MTKKEAKEIGASNAWTALDSFGPDEGYGPRDYARWEDAFWAFSENIESTIDERGGAKRHHRDAGEEYDRQWEKAGFDLWASPDIYGHGEE